jgi:hypothetical protein
MQGAVALRLVVALLFDISSANADRALFARLCSTADCNGTFARLEVFHDAAGRLAIVRYRGDFRRCSHPPAIYFDKEGKQLAVVDDWLRVDKELLAHAARLHAEMTKGHELTATMGCADFCKAPASIESLECLPP